jgi:hypothetical protein
MYKHQKEAKLTAFHPIKSHLSQLSKIVQRVSIVKTYKKVHLEAATAKPFIVMRTNRCIN